MKSTGGASANRSPRPGEKPTAGRLCHEKAREGSRGAQGHDAPQDGSPLRSPSPQGLCCSECLRTMEGAEPRGTTPQPSPRAQVEGACGARISKSNRRIVSWERRRLTHQWRSTSYASAGDKGNHRPGPPFSSGGPQSPRGSGPRVGRRDQPTTKTEHQGDLRQGRLPDARCQSPRQGKQPEPQGPQS